MSNYPEQKFIAVQHNKLIESKYSLTLQEKRILLYMIAKIDPKQNGFTKQRISIKELAKFIGLGQNKHIYKQMAVITKKLLSKTIEIEEPENNRLTQLNWLNFADYHYGEGYVILGFSNEMAPYLLALKRQFTQMRLDVVLSLSSIYAIRLYELLKQYESIGQRIFELDELRSFLGIGNEEYKKYSNFKIKVLSIAQREINEKTELYINFSEIKKGKKVTGLCFYVIKKETVPENLIAHKNIEKIENKEEDKKSVVIPDEILKKLRYFGLSIRKITQLVHSYGVDVIEAKLKDFERIIDSGKNIKNPAGWLISAIEKDWTSNSIFQAEQEEFARLERERLRIEEQEAREKARLEVEMKRKKLEFEEHVKHLFLSKWEIFPPTVQAVIAEKADFNVLEKRSYGAKGPVANPAVLLKLKAFVLTEDELDFKAWLNTEN